MGKLIEIPCPVPSCGNEYPLKHTQTVTCTCGFRFRFKRTNRGMHVEHLDSDFKLRETSRRIVSEVSA